MEDIQEQPEGAKHYIQMNKWNEELMVGDIEGQDELVPVDGRDYILQMIVSPVATTVSSEKTKYTYLLKRSAGFKLIAVPQGEVLKQKIIDE